MFHPINLEDILNTDRKYTLMAKYLILWELDASRIPEDPKERGAAWTMIADMIKEDLKAGFDVDWGAFISEGKGYTISDGNDMEIVTRLQRFMPFVHFEVHPVMTIDQIGEVAKSMME